MMPTPELEAKAKEYCERRQLSLSGPLGGGTDGEVWLTKGGSHASVVKAFQNFVNYTLELECYLRLREYSIVALSGFNVPMLFGHSDDLLVIEMSHVSPPSLLDFGKAHINFYPYEQSEEKWQDWRDQGLDRFGEKRWTVVLKLVRELESYGIYYFDTSPGNIMFRGAPEGE